MIFPLLKAADYLKRSVEPEEAAKVRPANLQQLFVDSLRGLCFAPLGHSPMATVYNHLDQFGTDRLSAIVDIDMTPYLFADEDWPHGVFGTLNARTSLDVQRQMISDRTGLMDTLVPAMFAAGATPDDSVLTWWADQSTTVPDLTALALWVSFSSQDWRPLLPTIDVPVLLAHGTKSQIYPTNVWDYLAERIPETQVRLFENSGHSPFWEEPDAFNETVLDFVGQL